MGLFKRALLYSTRKKGKSLIIFLVLLIVATFALAGLAIRKASSTAALNLRQSLGGEFIVKGDTSNRNNYGVSKNADGRESYIYKGKNLNRKSAEKIMSVSGIDHYNAENMGYAELKDANLKYLKPIVKNDFLKGNEDIGRLGKIVGVSNTEYDDYFSSGAFKIIDGKHINGSDKQVAVISKTFADKNHLKVGDSMVLSMSYFITNNKKFAKLKIKLKIAGIFDIAQKQATSDFTASCDLVENMVFMDIDSYCSFFSWGSNGYEAVHYFVNDPGKMNDIISKVKKISSIDWSTIKVDVNDTEYDKAAEPLQNLGKLITTLIVISIIISVAVLSLLLSMWIKTRIQETGVLMSIGIGKGKIMLQYIVEVLMIAVIAFGLSYFSGNAVAQGVGNTLLKYSNSNSSSQIISQQTDPSNISPVMKNGNSRLTKISVGVEPVSLIWIYIAGCSVIVISVLISSAPILRLKPKEILTKMS